jgi:hypothetical protein
MRGHTITSIIGYRGNIRIGYRCALRHFAMRIRKVYYAQQH